MHIFEDLWWTGWCFAYKNNMLRALKEQDVILDEKEEPWVVRYFLKQRKQNDGKEQLVPVAMLVGEEIAKFACFEQNSNDPSIAYVCPAYVLSEQQQAPKPGAGRRSSDRMKVAMRKAWYVRMVLEGGASTEAIIEHDELGKVLSNMRLLNVLNERMLGKLVGASRAWTLEQIG